MEKIPYTLLSFFQVSNNKRYHALIPLRFLGFAFVSNHSKRSSSELWLYMLTGWLKLQIWELVSCYSRMLLGRSILEGLKFNVWEGDISESSPVLCSLYQRQLIWENNWCIILILNIALLSFSKYFNCPCSPCDCIYLRWFAFHSAWCIVGIELTSEFNLEAASFASPRANDLKMTNQHQIELLCMFIFIYIYIYILSFRVE